MKKYLAFALALIMALALIPGAALADKGGWDGGQWRWRLGTRRRR